ncbi:cinnamoyl-CoA reductase 1 isoform X2 [Momordica charantia]|uniref:Cinnamoyl-CoA reductase 1 isoform X2 n=1 Tax=Momordica charantia TaxID=3673 RepID=A0A6J1CFH9_MOMCH|nr:cinnamoyl-CoA reductase 1 isoform X2 [Momordica charantia]
MATVARKGKVCVTGAGGFIGSWVVKLLLSRDYIVHGTVREPGDAKYAHLRKLEKGTENLELFKADLLDYESLRSAIAGCEGVFHVASPVPSTTSSNPETEVIEPAVKGTLNVLEACLEAKVKRVVVVSSVAAVVFNPSWPQGQVMDESCWSDKEYCKATKNWYFLSKTEAESEALEFGKRRGLDVVTVCPSFVMGPILQPTVNASTLVILKLLKEGYESVENRVRTIVDVRDVGEALLLVYEKGEAEGRFIEVKKDWGIASSERLQRLGWRYRALEDTLGDAVHSFKDAALLH